MDLLVVVGEHEVPKRLENRATHIVRTASEGMSAELVEHLRKHSPINVGVVGSSSTAEEMRGAGYSVVEPSLDDNGTPMQAADSVLDLIGNTPLVRLDRLARNTKPHVLAKLEYLNPGGSVKDRPALTMIEEAERQGLIKPGGTIVEPTSGNTGVGLAIVAARKKYKCVFVCPDKVSQEKINLLRAYGAEVHVCPTAVPPEHPESYYSVSDRLAREIPGAYKPDQYQNPANPLAHERATGPEIWEQTAGRITHFVAGVGTAGTIVGTAKYLKSKNPDIKIVGADPEGSVYSGGTGRPYLVEGVGEDFFPGNYDRSMLDEVIAVSDRESFNMARTLTVEEGIFTGGSSGMAVAAALKLAERLTEDDVVVVLVPDSGRGYLSKIYNDDWMAEYGFSHNEGKTALDVLSMKSASSPSMPAIVHVHPHETVREVAATMREFSVSQVVVVSAEPPLVMGEVAGSVVEEDLMQLAFEQPAVLDKPIGDFMGAVPPTIGAGELAADAIERLANNPALLVVDAGHPIGILTRSDLLEFLTQ